MIGLFLLILLAVPCLAQTPNTRQLPPQTASPPATVEQLSWLTGNWLGEGFGGELSEETWQPARAKTMLGIFRQHAEGKPMFYELMLLHETGGTVELRLKHFNPDLTGWEEKDKFLTFKLVALEPNTAYFSGLTYRREGDTLRIFLAMRREGKLEEAAFTLKRTGDDR